MNLLFTAFCFALFWFPVILTKVPSDLTKDKTVTYYRELHEWLSLLKKGLFRLGRRRGVMSDEFKYELAKDLGFYDTVKNGGWGEIRARDAGNMVKRAIEIAEQQMAQNQNNR